MEANKETIEEAAKRHTEIWFKNCAHTKELFIAGAEWQAERMYTEEDLRQAYNYGMFAVTTGRNFKDWFTNYKKK